MKGKSIGIDYSWECDENGDNIRMVRWGMGSQRTPPTMTGVPSDKCVPFIGYSSVNHRGMPNVNKAVIVRNGLPN
jgi:hypothetical protein